MHGKIYGVRFASKGKENKLLTIINCYLTNSTFVLCRKFVISFGAFVFSGSRISGSTDRGLPDHVDLQFQDCTTHTVILNISM